MPQHRFALVLAAFALACAHAPNAPPKAAAKAEAAPADHRPTVEDLALGYSFSLPPHRNFRRGPDGDSIAAIGDDGTVVRVFPLFLATTATDLACWQRVLEAGVLPRQLDPKPADASALAKAAPDGLKVPGGGRLFVQVYPRGDACLVLGVDAVPFGKAPADALREVAKTAMGSFRALAPAAEAEPELLTEAGFQLLEQNANDAALARFDAALAKEPSLSRAELGAGLAAFFAGQGHEKEAIAHLEKAVANPPAAHGSEERQYREAIMDLGLAYASAKEYAKAKEKLVEATDRYPDDAEVHYNLACVLARSSEADDAMDELSRALKLDPTLASHAKDDDDLASLRARADFAKLVGAKPKGGVAF